MPAIRVLHQFASDDRADEVAAYAARVRSEPGAAEAEAYAAVDGSGRLALVERWADEAAYAVHWAAASADADKDVVLAERLRAGTAALPSEFYVHQPFRSDRVWLSVSLPEKPAIVWPAAGGVRIVLQLGLTDSPELRAGLVADAAMTTLEPGCRHYQWLQGIDTPEHFLLLELWDSQPIYDNHWHLRLKTGAHAGGEMPMAPRSRGDMGIEFYRHQPFTHLYDRWLPADPAGWSETVVWPA